MTRSVRSGFRTCRHARARMQGRAIREKALDLVLDYGTEEKACGGRTRVRLDRDTRLELERDHPELRGRLGIFAILAVETVVTVCHDSRHHRSRRNHRRRSR
ncbi:hypothetical protein [uncultured Jannaschia sp.]|uniref:hypothetical protein n=1 Tax=uncultured Jannaschia sp. TaxID=293347 RepID=UPI00260BDF3A|nr:hypothetical protein [uncultured Jannaschia sp.]